MSTVSGAESVRRNLTPRRTRPGLTGRRLALLCPNEHELPQATRHEMAPGLARCPVCGATGRQWVWLCAPLWREALEWLGWLGRAAICALPRVKGLRLC